MYHPPTLHELEVKIMNVVGGGRWWHKGSEI